MEAMVLYACDSRLCCNKSYLGLRLGGWGLPEDDEGPIVGRVLRRLLAVLTHREG